MGSSYEDLLPPVSEGNYSDLLPPVEGEEKRKNRFADLMPSFSGVEGAYSGEMPPINPKEVAEGIMRTGVELPLFPARAVGEFAAASAGRPMALEGVFAEGGQTDPELQKQVSEAYQGGIDALKEMAFGAEPGALAIEEGLSVPFAVIGAGPKALGEYVTDKTGDPLMGKAAEYGLLVGMFKAAHAGGKAYKGRAEIIESIKERIRAAKDLKESVDEHVSFLDYGEGKRGPERRDTSTRLSDESYREMLAQERAREEVKYDDLLPPEESIAKPPPADLPESAVEPVPSPVEAAPTAKKKPKKGDRLLPAKLYLSPEEYRDQKVWQSNLQNFFTRDDKAVRWDKQVQELISQGVLPEGANLDTLTDYIRSYQKARKEGVSTSEFKAGYGDVTERKGAEYGRKQAEHEAAQQEEFKPIKFEGNILEEGDKFFYRGEEYEVMEKRESGVLIQDGNLEWVDNDGYFFADHGKIVRGGKEFEVREGVKYDDLLPPKEDQTQLPGVKADFKLASEEAATTGEFRTPAAADQVLLPGTEKAYRDVGMGEEGHAQFVNDALGAMVDGKDEIKKVFVPYDMGRGAEVMAGMARETAAATALHREQVGKKFEDFAKIYDRMGDRERLADMDAVEVGRSTGDVKKDNAFKVMRETREALWKVVQERKGIQSFIDNYMPHFWKEPEKAARAFGDVYGKRPLTGPASFLKRRKIPTTKEGMELGLEPVTTNPVELEAMKIHELYRFIKGEDLWNSMGERGMRTFIRFGKKAPEGYVKLNDKLAKVWGGTKVSVRTVLDELARGSKYTLWKSEFAKKIYEKGEDGQPINPDMRKEVRDMNLYGQAQKTGKSIGELIVRKFVSDSETFREKFPNVYEHLRNTADEYPELGDLFEIPKFTRETLKLPVGGMILKGEWYAPEQIARVFNNHLSPGLWGRSAIFDAYRGMNNFMNMVQLGMSGYHFTFTVIDSISSTFSLGLKELGRHQFAAAAKHLAQSASFTAPIWTYAKGSRAYKEILAMNPSFAKEMNAIISGGGRLKMDRFWKNSSVEKFWEALRPEHMKQAEEGVWKFEGRDYFKAGIHAIPAAIEALSRPLMEVWVPRMKVGLYLEMAESQRAFWEKEGHVPTPDKVRSVYGEAWDSVDNRMGQLVYDNLFWKKSLKEVLMSSVRSLGWNLGDIRELGGGVIDIKDIRVNKEGKVFLTDRTAYVLALPAVVGLAGALYQYLRTGQPPSDIKDLYFPKTGHKNADDTDERVFLPTYMKDVFPFGRYLVHGEFGKIGTMAAHKAAPLLNFTHKMLTNANYYGVEVVDWTRREPRAQYIMRTATEMADAVVDEFKPFSFRGIEQRTKAGGGLDEKLESFFGIMPAPKYARMTRAEEVLDEFAKRHYGKGPISKEDFERRQKKGEVSKIFRYDLTKETMTPEETERLSIAIKDSGLTLKDLRTLLKRSQKPVEVLKLAPLTVREAMDVWRQADDKEKQEWAATVFLKVTRNQSTKAEDKLKYIEIIKEDLKRIKGGK